VRGGVPILTIGERGETHSLVGEGVGGPNSDDWRDTLVAGEGVGSPNSYDLRRGGDTLVCG
jgi:hypothetical protein